MTDQQLVQLDDLVNTVKLAVRDARVYHIRDEAGDRRLCRVELDKAQAAIENAGAILRGGERA